MVNDIQYTAGETIYDIGHESSAFYMVQEGIVNLSTVIEMDSYYRAPISRDKWEVTKEVKTVQYKLRNIFKGQCFGHEEIFSNLKTRKCKATA